MIGKGGTILHVDDELDTLDVVRTILEIEGFEIVSVEDGEQALEQIKLHDFDLMLLDIMMPDMSGLELLSRISEMEQNYRVIFLTVLEASEEQLKQLTEYGIKDYITKPFDRDNLVQRVKIALAS